MLRKAPLPSRRLTREAATVVVVTALAFAVGFWNQSHSSYAGALAMLPLLVLLLARPLVPLALGVATLPLMLDVVGGSVHLTLSDVLLTFTFIAALPPLLLLPAWRGRLRGAAPLLATAGPFVAWLGVVTADHASLTNLAKTGQYYQLFLLPILLGAVVIGERSARIALVGFVLGAIVVATLWATTGGHFSFAANKNPAGQMITDGVLVVMALAPTWIWRIACLAPLGVGLAFTQSRGAILGAGVGIVVILALRGLGSWRRTLAAIVPLVVLVGVGYQFLPEDIQARATDYSTGNAAVSINSLTSAQYALRSRQIYADEGWQLVNSRPVFGVGPGNYETGVGTVFQTTDPHDLVIRTAGDSGYPGLVAFGVLVLGSAAVAFRRRTVNPYAVVAIAVQAAIITHSFVDVYWVRGTPVLGWLLIGMAVNRRLDRTRDRPERDRRGVPQRRSAPALPVLTPPRTAGVGYRQLG